MREPPNASGPNLCRWLPETGFVANTYMKNGKSRGRWRFTLNTDINPTILCKRYVVLMGYRSLNDAI